MSKKTIFTAAVILGLVFPAMAQQPAALRGNNQVIPIKVAAGDLKLAQKAPAQKAPAQNSETATLGKTGEFATMLLFGTEVLKKYGDQVFWSQMGQGLRSRAEKLALAVNARKKEKAPDMQGIRSLYAEAEALEADMILKSVNALEAPFTAPSRTSSVIPSSTDEDLRNARKRFIKEVRFMIADWDKNTATLKKFGFEPGENIEGERLKMRIGPDSAPPIDKTFEQAAAFYRKTAQERHRLGAEIMSSETELDSLLKSAELRKSLGAKLPDTGALSKNIGANIKAWRSQYNSRNYFAALDSERLVKADIQKVKDAIFAEDGRTPVVRPGASFTSTGIYADGGDWQTLPNSMGGGAGFFRPTKTAFGSEFMPYTNEKLNWKVSFEPTGTVNSFEVKDASWTHSHRVYTYRRTGSDKTEAVDCWWSFLAPGVMFEAHAPEIAVADSTTGTPLPPDKIVIMGKEPIILKKGETVDSSLMNEGWLLALWENAAPQVPILVYFEKRPEKFEWKNDGLYIVRAPELGKYAAAMLYGAVPQIASWSKDWEKVPENVVKQCRAVASRLIYYPLSVDEFYSVEKDSVKVWNSISNHIELKDDWKTPVKPYVPAPYLYSLGIVGGLPVKFEQPLSESLMNTKFGFFRATDGLNLSYTMPRVRMRQRNVLKPVEGEDQLIAEYNRHMVEGGQENRRFYEILGYICGGWCLTDGKTRDWLNNYKDPQIVEKLVSGEMPAKAWAANPTIAFDLNFVLESTMGRSCWMRGWRGNRHGIPVFGDPSCFNTWSMAGAYASAVYFGNWEIVRKNWDIMKQLYVATAARQGWAVPTQDCLTSGWISSGDMLGDGWRSNSLMASMARIIGDKETEALADYLGSRAMMAIGVLMHPNVIAYTANTKNIPAFQDPDAKISGQLGSNDQGFLLDLVKQKKDSETSWNAPFQTAGCGNYDYPFFGCIMEYFPDLSRQWIDNFMGDIPEWSTRAYRGADRSRPIERNLSAWNTLKFLACSTQDKEKIRALYAKDFTPPSGGYATSWKLFGEWWGYINALPHVIAQNDPLWLNEWGQARLESGTYDRTRRAATVNLKSAVPGSLAAVSLIRPEKVVVNGRELAVKDYSYDKDGRDLIVPFAAGESRIEVLLPEFKLSDLRYPIFTEAPKITLNLPKAPPPGLIQGGKVLAGDIKTEKCTPIDLRKFCNMGFDDKTANDKQGGTDDNGDTWLFPKGIISIRGVPFDFVDPDKNGGKSCLVLKGSAKSYFPAEAKNIPVNKVFKRIFFLHGKGSGISFGEPVMTYVLNFEGGQKRKVTVKEGVDIGEWKVKPGEKSLPDLAEARGGIHYPAGRKGQWGEGAGGYIFEWKIDVAAGGVTNQVSNQQGLAKLESIDIISAGKAVPLIFAITGEE